MKDQLSLQELRNAVPKKSKNTVTQELVDTINQMAYDEEFMQDYRNNILGYVGILKDGRYKVTDYLNAVRYVSFRLMGNNKITSYIKTFPDRYEKFLLKGASAKTISSYSTSYSKGELVIQLLEQSMVPVYIMNQDMFQEALNKQKSIMNNDEASFKVQSDAANSLLTHLKPPEEKKVDIQIDVKQHSYIDDLRKSAEEFAEKQVNSIAAGEKTAQEIAHSKHVIEHEPEDE